MQILRRRRIDQECASSADLRVPNLLGRANLWLDTSMPTSATDGREREGRSANSYVCGVPFSGEADDRPSSAGGKGRGVPILPQHLFTKKGSQIVCFLNSSRGSPSASLHPGCRSFFTADV